jgi:hypothetical protein
MNSTIQIILIIVLIIFIYNFLNEKDKFQSTNNLIHQDKRYRLNNPRLESIKRYVDDKQQLLEDVKNFNCKTSQDIVYILNEIKGLKDSKHEKTNTLALYEKEIKYIEENADFIFSEEQQINEYHDNLNVLNEQIKELKKTKTNLIETKTNLEKENQSGSAAQIIDLKKNIKNITKMLVNLKESHTTLKDNFSIEEKGINEMNAKIKEFKLIFSDKDTYTLEIIKLKKEIVEINDKIKIANNKLENKYCPKLLKDTSTNNFKTSSFLDDINLYHISKLVNLNKNMKEYKSFSDNYSVKNEPAISNSLDYLNEHLQMKSFNDNVPALEMMKDTLEFSNQVPPIVSEEEMVRLYPYNFTDFNGNYSINLGNFNYRIIDNRHTIKIEITSNEELPMSQNNTLNSIFSNSMGNDLDTKSLGNDLDTKSLGNDLDTKSLGNDLDTKSFGNIKVFDKTEYPILHFEIVNISRAELPQFPTTTIVMNIKSKNIYNHLQKPLTEKEQKLKYQKLKLLKELGLKDGGIYLHGNDGQFNLYNFNKLHILNMSPI